MYGMIRIVTFLLPVLVTSILSQMTWAQSDTYEDSLTYVVLNESASPANLKEATFLLGEYLVQRKPEKAEEYARTLQNMSQTPADSNEWLRLNYIFAASHRWQGNFQTSLAYYQQNYEYAKRETDYENIALSGDYIGTLNTFLGNNVTAQKHLLESAEIYDSIGTPSQRADMQSALAGFYLNIAQAEDAERRYQKALEIYTSVGDTIGMARTHCNLGLLYSYELEDLDLAEMHLARMAEMVHVFPTNREKAFYHDFMGILRQNQNRLQDAYQEHLTALNIRKNLSSISIAA